MPTGNLLVFAGDSLVYGGTYHDTEGCLADATSARVRGSWTLNNVGVGGYTYPMLIVTQDVVTPLYDGERTHNILAIQCGTNDLNLPNTVAQLYAYMRQYCLARKAEGWTVVVGTVPPRTDIDFIQRRADLNALIVAGYAEFADALADHSQDPYIGTGDFVTQPAYWLNAAHPNHVGYAVMATYFAAAIESILPPVVVYKIGA